MSFSSITPLDYPPARRGDVVDDYHGTPVADPYRWLEDADSAETQAWVAAQNALTRRLLDAVPAREAIRRRLTELWDFPKTGAPVRRGPWRFFTHNDGLQNQAVLYRQADDRAPEPLLDPNTLSPDGTAALTSWWPSRDGALLAYALSEQGSDWQTIAVRDVAAGQDLPDVIPWCKFTSVAWHPDGRGFYYNRFPEPGSVPPEEQYRHSRVYWHRLGSDPAADEPIYARPDAPDLILLPVASEDGRFLFFYQYRGTDAENRIHYQRLDVASPPVPWLDDADALYEVVATAGDVVYVHTNLGAPKGRIVSADLSQGDAKAWREVVPEGEDVISLVQAAGNHLVVARLRDARHVLQVIALDGTPRGQIPLPAMGSVLEMRGQLAQDVLTFAFTAFLFPTTVYRYDVPTGRLEIIARPEIRFDTDAFETHQVFATSADGTRVPVFVTHRKGLVPDGSHPTILYGYGGFTVNQLPQFWVSRTVWLEQGGVFAVAVIRGGNEYGEAWHRAGTLANKQNVFDDFIAAAEHLIAAGYTAPRRLAIHGGSNGGLLVAACMVQRPDLFGAVLCAVPVIDMLRYHRHTIGRYWVGEYGNAEEDPAHFAFLYRYSPLHNITPGRLYPPVLITTAESDDRVVPAHARKFAAALQGAGDGRRPALLRAETRAGHGLGKPTAKLIDEQVDLYAFLWRALDLDWPLAD